MNDSQHFSYTAILCIFQRTKEQTTCAVLVLAASRWTDDDNGKFANERFDLVLIGDGTIGHENLNETLSTNICKIAIYNLILRH